MLDLLRVGRLRTDWRAVTAITVATLTMTVEHYGRFSRFFPSKSAESAFVYLVVPLAVVVVVFREPPAKYGFQWGDWQAGLTLTAIGCGLMAVTLVVVARTPAFRGYYASQASSSQLPLPLVIGLGLVGWEFVFRGFLLFALYPRCGPLAIVLQAVPFTVAHFGKPELETLSCIFGGSALGYVAWRTRSFVYPFLIHWFLSTFTVLIASGAL